ncbi:MAG: hypothetical protein NC205_03300 [Prevotella sp.]|nr:hypothetical protein [Alistipes senegalensis]MCM1357594.1 hypothetical protein [Prevotella sp.]
MRVIIAIFSCIILLFINTHTAYAQARLDSFAVKSYNLPEEAVYMDMLISMNENDESYTVFNEENMKQYNFDARVLSSYNKEGFISMSCHYNNNFTKMKILDNNTGSYHNSFVLDKNSNGGLVANNLRVHEIFSENRQFCIALLDKDGNIIQCSKTFNGNGKRGFLIDYIKYDAKSNTLSLKYEYDNVLLWRLIITNPKYFIIIGIIICIVIIKLPIILIKRFIPKHKYTNVK